MKDFWPPPKFNYKHIHTYIKREFLVKFMRLFISKIDKLDSFCGSDWVIFFTMFLIKIQILDVIEHETKWINKRYMSDIRYALCLDSYCSKQHQLLESLRNNSTQKNTQQLYNGFEIWTNLNSAVLHNLRTK